VAAPGPDLALREHGVRHPRACRAVWGALDVTPQGAG